MKEFLLSLACGVLSGIVYDILYVIRASAGRAFKPPRDKLVTAACDILYIAALTAMFVGCSAAFAFPDMRVYMVLACLAGAALYIKSLHVMVAFLINKWYNRGTKIVKKR